MRYVIEVTASPRGGYVARVTAPDPENLEEVLLLPGSDFWSQLHSLNFHGKTFVKVAEQAADAIGKFIALDLLEELQEQFVDVQPAIVVEVGS